MTLLRRLLFSLLIVAIGLPAHAGMLPTQSALSAEPGAGERDDQRRGKDAAKAAHDGAFPGGC